jgi:hypothetical protein
MKSIGFQRSVYVLDFKLKIDFCFETSHVYSISQRRYDKMFPKHNEINLSEYKDLFREDVPERKERKNKFDYLIIDSTFEIHSYDSLYEGAAKIRPSIIVINGILSFITNRAIIPAMSPESHSGIISKHIIFKKEKPIAICKGDNLSTDLERLLNTITTADSEKRILFFSVLERWRKALYLEQESVDSDVFKDESVLAYMHVLEVLSDEFKAELGKAADKQREDTVNKIIEIVQVDKSNRKDLVKLLNTYENMKNSLKAKIFQMLNSLNLDNLKTRNIVERFIDHRNSIAHGRKNLFQETLIFPLPQFFSFIKDVDEDVELIKILAARCISKLFDMDLWEFEWDYKLLCERLPFKYVEEFIAKQEYNKFKGEDFFEYKENNVSPYALAFYYKKGKLSLENLEHSLEKVIISTKRRKEKYQQLFEAAVILSDSEKQTLDNKCRRIVSVVYQKQWFYYSNIRDVIKDYEYHGKKLLWFEEWLKEGKKIICEN